MMDYKTQKEEIAFYMQMLFDSYKEGNLQAYDELVSLHRRYNSYFADSKSKVIDFLRMRSGKNERLISKR